MKPRSLVVGVLTAGVMVIGGAGSASANIAWCSSDPPAKAETAEGANLMVNVAVSVRQPEARYLSTVDAETTSVPNGQGGTLITVQVHLPSTISAAKIVASVNRYQVVSSATGTGGSTVTLYLDVPKS